MKPKLRNLTPYQAIKWNQSNDHDRFTKREFLKDTNPSIWDIEEWNKDKRNEEIIIT